MLSPAATKFSNTWGEGRVWTVSCRILSQGSGAPVHTNFGMVRHTATILFMVIKLNWTRGTFLHGRPRPSHGQTFLRHQLLFIYYAITQHKNTHYTRKKSTLKKAIKSYKIPYADLRSQSFLRWTMCYLSTEFCIKKRLSSFCVSLITYLRTNLAEVII